MAQTETNKPTGRKSSGGFNRKTVAVIISTAFVFCVLCGGLTGCYLGTMSTDGIQKGVTVCGTDVGEMSLADAEMLVRDTYGAYFEDKTLKITHSGKEKEINLSGMIRLDAAKTAEAAFNVGKEEDVLKRITSSFFKSAKEVPLSLEINESFILSEISAFATEVEQGHSVFEISEDTKEVKIDLSDKSAVIANVPATAEKIRTNLSKTDLSDIELEMCKGIGKDLAEALSSRIARTPVDAAYRITDGVAEIVEHVNGVTVDKEEISKHIENGETVFTVTAQITEPNLTTEELKAKAFADVLGEETTKFNPGEVNRTANVRLAASLINGTIIPSGQEFSFNRVVGKRSYDRGFKDAGVYANGELVDGVGGGICQVASTIYTAQLYADLKTVSRRNHMFTVTYSPLGQDATVAWGSVDYVFANNTPYPIKIECTTGSNTVTVRIVGTKEDPSKSIKIINQTVGTSAFETKEEFVDELEKGETKIKQNGHNGATVDTYKVYLENGVEVNREYIHRSVYIPMTKIVQKSSLDKEGAEGEELPPEESEETENPEELPEGESTLEQTPEEELSVEETSSENVIPSEEENEASEENEETEAEGPELSDTGL